MKLQKEFNYKSCIFAGLAKRKLTFEWRSSTPRFDFLPEPENESTSFHRTESEPKFIALVVKGCAAALQRSEQQYIPNIISTTRTKQSL